MLSDNYACRSPYAAFGVVVVCASAGGIEALTPLLACLPGDFSSPIIVLMHLPPASRYISMLPAVLQRKTALRVKWAEDGESILPGIVYVAPQNYSTEIDAENGSLRVLPPVVPRARRFAADLLFSSAAKAFGRRSMAVVLSGVLSDGAAGSAMIARAGGRVLAQSPAEAQFPGMPLAAMRRSRVGLPFDSVSLACVISNLVMTPGVAGWFAIGVPRAWFSKDRTVLDSVCSEQSASPHGS